MSELPCSRVACTVVAQHVCRLANSAPRPKRSGVALDDVLPRQGDNAQALRPP